MKKQEAEKIINGYGEAIAKDKSAFRNQATLPCSKAKIRYAFYVYIAAILDDFGNLEKDIGENLVLTYSMLDSFVSEERANELNKISEMIKTQQLKTDSPADKKTVEEYFLAVRKALCNGDYSDEINDYIGECYKERGIGKTKI